VVCIILIVNANANDSHIDLSMYLWVGGFNKIDRRGILAVLSVKRRGIIQEKFYGVTHD